MRTILNVSTCFMSFDGRDRGSVVGPRTLLAQNSEALANQLDRLQRDVQVLSRQVFKMVGPTPPLSSPPPAKASASAGNAYIIRVEDRLSQLEGETRSNTGNIENITHALSQISARLDTLSNDINFRLQTIENRLNVISRNPQLLGPRRCSACCCNRYGLPSWRLSLPQPEYNPER